MSSCARWEQLESCRSDGIRPHTAVYAKRDALASRKIATYRVHGRSCGRGIAATAWLWSVCELGTAWGEENRVEKATTRVVQRPFLARNDKKAVQLLQPTYRVWGRRCACGRGIGLASLPPHGYGQYASWRRGGVKKTGWKSPPQQGRATSVSGRRDNKYVVHCSQSDWLLS